MDRVLEFKQKVLPVVQMATAIVMQPDYDDVEYLKNRLRLQMETRILRDNAGDPITQVDEKTYTVLEPRFPQWVPKWLQNRWSQEVTKKVTASFTIQPTWVYPDYYPSNQLGQAVRYIDDQPVRWSDDN